MPGSAQQCLAMSIVLFLKLKAGEDLRKTHLRPNAIAIIHLSSLYHDVVPPIYASSGHWSSYDRPKHRGIQHSSPMVKVLLMQFSLHGSFLGHPWGTCSAFENQGKNPVAQLVRQLNVRTTFEQKKQSGIMTETCSIMAIKFAVDLVLHLDQLEESSLRTWSGQLHWRHSLFVQAFVSVYWRRPLNSCLLNYMLRILGMNWISCKRVSNASILEYYWQGFKQFVLFQVKSSDCKFDGPLGAPESEKRASKSHKIGMNSGSHTSQQSFCRWQPGRTCSREHAWQYAMIFYPRMIQIQ